MSVLQCLGNPFEIFAQFTWRKVGKRKPKSLHKMNCIRNWNLKNGLKTMKIKKYNDIDAEEEVDDDDDDEELILNYI